MTLGQWGSLTKVNLLLQTKIAQFTLFCHGVNLGDIYQAFMVIGHYSKIERARYHKNAQQL